MRNESEKDRLELDINQTLGLFLIKDMNSNYIKGCRKIADFFGYKHGDDLISKDIYIMTHSIEMKDRNIIQNLNILEEDSYFNGNSSTVNYCIDDTYDDINLSNRQAECLFYLMRGKSYKNIAKILSLSPRTIESYVEEIKAKMRCEKKSDLIEKSISLGYLDIIPKSIKLSFIQK